MSEIARENTGRFLNAFDKISKVFAALESFSCDMSLSKPELLALEAISKEKGLIMSEIARRLEIRLSTATGVIDRLIEKKLVRRERNNDDRRIVIVVLTEKGKKIDQAYQNQKKEVFGKMLGLLTEDEQEGLVSILEKIADSMNQKDLISGKEEN